MTAFGEIPGVVIAGGTMRDDLRAVHMIWKRELIRYSRNRIRIVTSLAQPVLFLFVLGSGLSPLVGAGSGPHVDFKTFMFPGVIAMTILFTAIFSAVSIVWDREFGFLREMMVAPIRRGALVTGKTLGGATVATMQGVIMLLLGPLVGVPYDLVLIVSLLVLMALCALMLTAIGVVAASRMQQVESFQVVMQLFVLPMFFLAGAIFPLTGVPTWLAVLTRIDPLAYIVDPMRRAVFSHLHVSPAAMAKFSPGLHWGSWRLPVPVELAVVAAVTLGCLAVAVAMFSKQD
ncbi:MAG: type transport system permease protein [Acidimicrobiaceae bacterium]|jgi:ABC-2 type transport system permease protein|nr:type transport system permease protein [Acidimicrobiaceae bacterium]